MKRGWLPAALWSLLYLALAALPLVMAGVMAPPGRGFWIEFGVALGLVALAMFGLQFVLTARFPGIGRPYGIDTLLQFHRQAGIWALGLMLAHPIVLIAAEREYLEFFDPRVNLPRAVALVVATLAGLAVVATSLWRQSFRLNYEWWRLSHAVLGVLLVFIGTVHAFQVGHYVSQYWRQGLWIALSGVAIALVIHVRVVRPYLMRSRPYKIVEVRSERGDSWTWSVEPDGHAGMRFEAGQFVWITLGDTPFSLQQHPFSISSSAENPRRLDLTIRELGDFTSQAGKVEPGTRCYLEGPYGTFTLRDTYRDGAVFVMGGVGITPAMGILRTLHDRHDARPLLLIYGNDAWENVTFREQLDSLCEGLRLQIVHVLEQAPDDWQGETGLITPELLERHLPRDWGPDVAYFVCGPGPMMDIVESTLLERGTAPSHIFAERFDIV